MPNEIQKLPDGKISAKLEDGTIFEGDPLEVTTKLAEAKMNTVRWGQEWKQKYETASTVQPPPVTTQPPADASEKQLQEYLLNQTAKALGYESGEQYKAELTRVKGTADEAAKSMALQSFFTQHPEFPGTPEANDMIGKIFDEKGWKEMTSDNLEAAHLLAMDRHRRDPKLGYEPLSAEAINAAWANNMQQSSHRQASAPPMLKSNNPETVQNQNNDPWGMDMKALRNAAIADELNRNKK